MYSTDIKFIRKRDGRLEPFDPQKIETAIFSSAKAIGGENIEKAREITRQTISFLEVLYKGDRVPTVENVQDLVEKILIENGHAKTAKAYILYREQHAKLRQTKALLSDAVNMVDNYIQQRDWRVKENANMGYSLQGLNNFISTAVSNKYWLDRIYPKEIAEKHLEGDIHIHDLGSISAYCCGWDLKDLLMRGFGGAYGKVESKPPRHFRVALGQIVNFFYTLQGEAAGAQAFSNFDTLLAPFVHYDKLSYSQVRQYMQEFIFNINVPTRVGFQCMSEDTEILGINGWKKYNQVKKNDVIATFNVEKGFVEYLPVKKVFARKYKGKMYNLKNRISDQLISPEHRIVRRKFYAETYTLEKIENTLKLRSPFIVPVGSDGNVKGDESAHDDVVKLAAWIVSEGSLDKGRRGSGRISIYQSKEKSKENYEEIIAICERLKLGYTERSQKGLGSDCNVIRFDAVSNRRILRYFKSDKEKGIKFIPEFVLSADTETSRLFLETYIKGDGYEGCKILTASKAIKEGLLQVIVNAGFGAAVSVRKPDNKLSKQDRYIIRIIRHKDTYINKVKTVNYEGIIWCPNTENETVIARRNGKIFITGNTPFTNITMDLTIPNSFKNDAVVVGGELKDRKYGDFQHEADLINKAFCDVMIEGDAKGRIFSFPIPTYNITKDFDWDNPDLKGLWEMTSKYGIPYFSNFVNSDMDPDDARSMCPIGGDEKVLIRSNRGRGLEYSTIRNICEGNAKENDYEIYSDGKFVKGRFDKFLDQKVIKVSLENGHDLKMTEEHLNFVMLNPGSGIEELKGKELREGMYLPYSLKAYEGYGGNRDMGYFAGAYAGDGSLDGETTVVFSLEYERKKEIAEKLKKIAEEHFGATCTTKSYEDTRLFTLKIHSRAAVGLCKDFVSGKERDKHYRARLFSAGREFREGVIEGHYATDGGNRNRIYTSSPKMVETLNMLAATLGTVTSIYEDDREGRLGTHPNYAVLIYQLNRESYGDVWFKNDDKLWVKIKSIEPVTNSTAYCFEVESEEPMFTVGTTGILTHNCRLRLDNRELRKRGGGLFGSNPLTGSIGVVTLNIPRLAYMSGTKEDFYKGLDELLRISKEALEIKRKILEQLTEQGLYPYSQYYLSNVGKKHGSQWANHFSTIGLIGVNEGCENLLKEDISTEKGKAFALELLNYIRERMMEFQEETGHFYNLEATPAEGTSYRLAKMDKEKCPGIVTQGEEEPYYTNSSNLPVKHTDDLFAALDHQDEIQSLYTGGTVFHIFLGERVEDIEVCKKLVRNISQNYHMPYFTLSPSFTICSVHGYIPGEHFTCPYDDTGHEEENISKEVLT